MPPDNTSISAEHQPPPTSKVTMDGRDRDKNESEELCLKNNDYKMLSIIFHDVTRTNIS